jgi:hypothetical protein
MSRSANNSPVAGRRADARASPSTHVTSWIQVNDETVTGAVSVDLRREFLPTCPCYSGTCGCTEDELSAFFRRNVSTLRRILLPSDLRLRSTFWRAQPARLRRVYVKSLREPLAEIRRLRTRLRELEDLRPSAKHGRSEATSRVFVCSVDAPDEEQHISVHRTFGLAYARAMTLQSAGATGEQAALPKDGPRTREEIKEHAETAFDVSDINVHELRPGRVAKWDLGCVAHFSVERRDVQS